MKVNNSRVKIDSSVLPGIDVLSAEEREKLWQAIESLEQFEPERSIVYNVKKIELVDKPFYLIQVNDSLRLVFQLNEEDKIEIVNLFRQEAVASMFGK